MTADEQLAVTPAPALVRLTNIVYGLHAISLVIGAFGTATVIGAFLFGWPSIIAVVVNYVKRSEVRGTYLESHFRWQIRTFWFAALWVVIAVGLFVTVIGIPFAWLIVVVTGVWVLYRIGRGWLALNDAREIGA